jgi:hypothetical protein
MSLWMAKNNITAIPEIKKYSQNGYRFKSSLSDETTPVSVRKDNDKCPCDQSVTFLKRFSFVFV